MSLAPKLRRLKQMGVPELRFRAAQKLRIECERLGLGWNGNRRAAWLEFWDPARVHYTALREAIEGNNVAAAESLLPAYVLGRKTPRFFFSAAQRGEIVAVVNERFPARTEELLAEAGWLCAHRFRIFAYPAISLGEAIPWRRDCVHGQETGLDHWSRIPYLDFETCGDSKIVWEPNRHQHFVTLGQAFAVTGDERFAEQCLTQWEDWRRENPFRRGVNWASSLEAAFRAWSWLWMLHLLSGSRALTGARLGAISQSLAEHAQHIEENLSVYFSPNTHLLGEGFGLYVIGLLWPELRRAEHWRELGRRLLEEEMNKQVRPDGSHFEQSSYYHRYATDFFLCAAILAAQNAHPFPPSFLQRLERMCEFILHTQLPGGLHPMIGDADGGRLLSLTPNNSPVGPNDQRATLSVAAAFFGRADFLHAAGDWREESLWLDFGGWRRACESLLPAAPQKISRNFPDAGLVVQRSGSGANAHMLLFDAGPQGMLTCAHGHADTLQILCSANGEDWLVDPGTFVYTSALDWRDFFRSTRAHNTLVVDRLDQAIPEDVFKWSAIPTVRLESCVSNSSLDVAMASHNGYERLPQPVTHRRAVVFVKPDYWLVSDSVEGEGEHELEFNFHFPPGVALEHAHGAWLASQNGSRFLLVPTITGAAQVECGSTAPKQGWYSRDYGHREAAPALVFRTRAALPAQFHWLLWPVPPGWPKLTEMSGRGLRAQVETEAWTDCVVLRGQEAAPSGDGVWTDAEALHVRQNKTGVPSRLTLFRGCCAEINGRSLICAESMLDELEVCWAEGSLELRARPTQRMAVYAPETKQVSLNGKAAAFSQRGDWLVVEGEA